MAANPLRLVRARPPRPPARSPHPGLRIEGLSRALRKTHGPSLHNLLYIHRRYWLAPSPRGHPPRAPPAACHSTLAWSRDRRGQPGLTAAETLSATTLPPTLTPCTSPSPSAPPSPASLSPPRFPASSSSLPSGPSARRHRRHLRPGPAPPSPGGLRALPGRRHRSAPPSSPLDPWPPLRHPVGIYVAAIAIKGRKALCDRHAR